MQEVRRHKFPRILHLPGSLGRSRDDLVHQSTAMFDGRHVIVTEKLDGECSTLASEYMHARSLDSRMHSSRSWLRNLHGQIAHLIPDGYRICGEYVAARHSIGYSGLPGFFFLFGVYDQENICLSWKDTVEWAGLLDLPIVPLLYDGTWDEIRVTACYTGYGEQEGYVVRLADAFHYSDSARSMAKWVRAGHVQTLDHWMDIPIVWNCLAETLDTDHGKW